jgi:hypothetical protein
MKLLTGLSVFLLAAGGSAVAKECRMPDIPPGVQVQLPPGCDNAVRTGRPDSDKLNDANGNQGFIDLGNGTRIRVNGRVRAEYGVRR